MFRKNCLICDSKNIVDIIDLGMHPFADTFISKSKIHLSEKVYPLIVQLCENCGNIQLSCETIPEDRYQDNEYSYTSTNSNYSINYWSEYSKEVLKLFSSTSKLKILEIGSNDGFLLSLLKKHGHNVLGIDASAVMNELASKRGVNTKLGIFDEKFAKDILSESGKFDLIIANNVFNHADNPQSFFKAVRHLLEDQGIFIFESPYWLNSIKSGKFDQIYHEHVTYLTARATNKIVSINNMYISDILLSEYHGGSIRFIVSNNKNKKNSEKVKHFIQEETKSELYSPLFYKKFMHNLNQKKNVFMEKIYKNLIDSSPLVCIGAAAKANTFLNFYGLDNKLVDYITDTSSIKIGKYTPLTRIPITPDEIIKNLKNPNIIFTAWNVSDNLRKIIYKINPKYKELNPYEN
jgi:SAM-dependent methyltransferase